MSADEADANDADPMESAEAWQALDREEQSAILDEGLADLKGETDGASFRHLDDQAQRETIAAVERGDVSETERAMQAALEETFTVAVFEGLDDVPTVPFECHPLSSAQRDVFEEAMGLMAQLEGLADANAEDVDADGLTFDGAEHFDSPADLEAWLVAFLESVTVDDAFDAERWRSGEGLRSGTRSQLLVGIYIHHAEEDERAIKFRAESGGT